ncbi:Rpn family recombination-promoting nuclease/putative transposase [Chromatium okenii]|uniref:Transposase n=1 Tax=Chromatium okenii TaxID=61644 RepID=A0A2S7XQ73_9GAMM|nr:Rpn family recombination-promoting nuclease/putative transposase [Chromatium okenii]PQJ95588.1 transposase [Chromatium okenii]
MRFLNPKTDYTFKKIFGSETSHEILISFLNAILNLSGAEEIIEVTIIDPYQAPKIQGLKNTFLDVKVRDQSGHFYIVEMQVLNVEGFEKRVLYNTCKAYVNQLGKGEAYRLLTSVVAITIADFIMFSELQQVVSQFRLSATENPAIYQRDLELVFAELPKFDLTEAELKTPLDRWFYFLKTAENLTAVPESLAVEPAIAQALELANRAGWSEEELDDVEKREMWLEDQRYLQEQAHIAEQRGLKKGLEQGLEKGRIEGVATGATQAKAEMLLLLLRQRFGALPAALETQIQSAPSAALDAWIVRILTATDLAAVFTDEVAE